MASAPTVQTQGNLSYIGNPDFRGYLNALGSQGNGAAQNAVSQGGLGYVDNNGNVNLGALTSSGVPQANAQSTAQYLQGLYKQYQGIVNPPAAGPASTAFNGYTAAVAAPAPNWDAINANATARANDTANAYYTKSINDFMAQQAQQQSTQAAGRDISIQNAQDTLKNLQAANATTEQRTTADTATKEAQAAQATDWRQTDQGGQYDMTRIADAINQAKAGTAGSGIGAGQQLASQDKFNTTESRQATQDQQAQAATELAKTRTFEDLATSNTLGTQAEQKSEQAAKFSFDSFVQQQSMDLLKQQQAYKAQQNQYFDQIRANQIQGGVQDFYKTLTNPAQQVAFAQAYGKYL